MSYRETDVRSRCELAWRRCKQAEADLAQARREAAHLALSASAMQAPVIQVPQYTPVPPVPAYGDDATLGHHAAKLEGLAAYLEGEVARIGQQLNAASQSIRNDYGVAQLGPGPRAVPITYIMAELLRGFWVVLQWLLFPPITMVGAFLAAGIYKAAPQLMLAPLAVLLLYDLLRAWSRIRMLWVGECPEILSRSYEPGTGYYKSWPRLVTRGWAVRPQLYTGSGYRTRVVYRMQSGAMGEVVVGGPMYEGYVLADPRKPQRALPLSAFGSTPRPNERGEWDWSLPARAWAWMSVTVLLVAGLTSAALYVTATSVLALL